MSRIEDKLARLSPEQRAFVELQLQKRAQPVDAPVPRSVGSGPLPLSSAQKRLWLLSQLEPGSPAYVMPGAVRLTGQLNLDALQRALDAIVERHEILRTTFSLDGDEPRQIVHPSGHVPVEAIDLTGIPREAREAEARRHAVDRSRQPFDLNTGPLVRAAVVALGADDHVLLFSAHHIVSDGWSLGIFVSELGELYRSFDTGRPATLVPLPVQYADFAVWQRESLTGERGSAQREYWKRRLANVPPLQLPLDKPRPSIPSADGAVETLVVPSETLAGLRALTQAENATLFMTLLAGFSDLLSRYSGQDDIAIGSPIANRTRAELEPLIGCFVNSLVFRTDVSGDPSARSLLRRVRETSLEAYANQDLPFEQLVEELQPERSVNQNPLFQVMFAVQNQPSGELDLGALALGAFDFPLTTTRFDLEMHITERGDTLGLRVCYRTDLFEAATMRRLLAHYAELLAGMAAAPDVPLSRLPILDRAERDALFALNPPATEFPRAGIIALFSEQARLHAEAIAVEYGERRLTYAELDARSDALASVLAERGVRRGTFVGLLVERTPEMVVALLAILKAGGAYVPLDAAYPAERLQLMIEDAAVPVIVYHEHLRNVLPDKARASLALVPLREEAATRHSAATVAVSCGPSDVAYVIYTSGSTGVPKGVVVPQGAVVRLVRDTNYISLGAGERIGQASSSSFDAATFEIWGALLNGGTLVGIEKDAALTPASLARAIDDRRLTALFLTTALFNQIAREAPRAFAPLRHLLFGGEAVDAASVATVMRSGAPARLLHVYGPTESTTYATWYLVPGDIDAAGPVPIGRALSNSTLYVLDAAMQPVPLGVVGELYIGGEGLAHGYLNRPDLTAERFIPDPFAIRPGQRLYLTGDLVRWTRDGEVEFLGRNDGQVKVRGFRIELGEIEATLRRHPGIRDAVVLARQEHSDRRLVAYVVPSGGGPSWDALREYLRERLPDYMVPSAFVALDHLPLNANGKIDRGRLPAPPVERQIEHALVLPRTELERRIAAAWREVLRVPEIGVSDNFFDLGGHSLRLLQVHALLVKALDREVPIVDLFRFPTIASLAAHLGDEHVTPAAQPAPPRRGRSRGPREPIAVIGMAGRFPGAADVETFWENLRNEVESIAHFTDDEVRAVGASEALLANPRFVKAFGVLPGFDLFDAAFFGYSAREAAEMDPQHRHFLECAWEALERAGYDPFQYDGSIGVWAGCSPNLYLLSLFAQVGGSSAGTMAAFLGNMSDYMPTRVAYKLNLRGPGVNVQCACSTSLVAVHHACQSLLNGECDIALAGGANVKRSIASGYLFEEGGILSPDGHCRAFDADAHGTVGGSGVGVVVLKRLTDALADGDQVHAVILGSAINNDGSDKVGYTAPGVRGQADVIKAAHAVAGVDPRTIGYIEAHGTGTLLGDPIEVEALSQAFGRGAGPATCALGSVKSNIGHLDAAAGVTGLIKGSMVLEQGQIPASLHFKSPNPKMRLDETPFYVSTKLHDFPKGATPRRVGVSAFGIGGTNAHVVLEEAPPREPSSESRSAQLIVLSARSKAALDRATDNVAKYFEAHPDLPLADAAFTLQTGRRRFRHRRMVVCDSAADLRRVLQDRDPKRLIGADSTATTVPIAFIFPGQGAQAVNMARGLYDTEPVFRGAVDRCADLLRSELKGDLRDVLYPSPELAEGAVERLTQTAWSQPALFVVEYSLAKLWESWGISPDAMIGHSLGEYVAACLAGVFTLEDALALVAARGRMMQALPPGGMVAVPVEEGAVRPLLTDGLSVAALNAPSATVVSGPFDQIEAFERAAAAAGMVTRRLVTSHAFHSSMLDPMLCEFESVIRRLKPQPPTSRFVSNVTGTWIEDAEATDPAYWVRHLRGTVRFGAGLATLLGDGKSIPLEVGPGQGLTSLARAVVAGSRRHAVASLASRTAGPLTDVHDIVDALGRLWLAGAEINWAGFHSQERRHRIVLPTYPFERQQFALAAPAAAPRAAAAVAAGKRPDVDSWIYGAYWKKVPLAVDSPAEVLASLALVFADRDSIGDEVARRLPNAAVVRRGSRYAKADEREYVVDPSRREDFEAVLTDLAQRDLVPTRVVHAWEASDGAGEMAFETLLYAVQALVARGVGRPAEVTVLATGLHAINEQEPLAPRKALMNGLGRVISQEQPHIRFRTVDVSQVDAPAEVAEHLVRELASWTYEPSVAYRGLERYVEAFDAIAPTTHATRKTVLREHGVYLITGGLGAIGLTIAAHLMSTLHARVVLVGRTEPPPRGEWDALIASPDTPAALRRRLERLKQLEPLGGEVIVRRGDVTSLQDMHEAIAHTESRFGGLDGVIHGAVLSGAEVLRPVDALSAEDARRQLAPKVDATMILEQALGDRQLDFCLLMSSLSSVLGGIGFGGYAASNAFLDAFAHEHNRRGRAPWIAVNWDNWTMTEGAGPGAAVAMTHPEGMEALDRVLKLVPSNRVLVSAADLSAQVRRYVTRPPVAPDTAVGAASVPGERTATVPDTARRPLEQWFYVPSWKRSVPPLGSRADGSSPWLIFADYEGFGDEIARRAALEGVTAVMVRAGDRFSRTDAGEFTVAPECADDYAALFRDLKAGPGLPRRIVHCWSVSAPRPADGAVDSPGFLSLLYLAQALSVQTFDWRMSLHAVTSRAQEVTGLESLIPEHALVSGPVNVFPYEDPRVACVQMDVDAGWASAPEPHWRALIAELHAEVSDRAIAYRAGHRWVQIHERVMLPGAEAGVPPPLRQHGVYLITGGLGGVGLAIARYLAREHGARLVLTSRRVLPPRAEWQAYLEAAGAAERSARDIRAVQDLEALGADVMVAGADVCDEAAMREVVADATHRFGAIHGVVHSAGVAGGGLIQLKTRDAAARVLAPKTLGTRTLAAAVEGQPLDFFVLCSSLAGLGGGLGQIDYCAANSYQDAFAREYAKRTGVPMLAINWDTWRDAGMAIETELPEALRARRQTAVKDGMSSEEGIEVFLRALRRVDLAQIAVSTVSLEPRIRGPQASAPPVEEARPQSSQPEAKAAHTRPELGSDYAAPRTDAERALCGVWEEVLGATPIGVNDDFFELGGHSLMALQMLSRVRERLGVDLSIHQIFNAPTVAQLAELVQDVGGQKPANLDTMEELLSMVEGLPDAELNTLLEPQGD